MSYPSSYRFTKEHEWIDAQGAEASIGITDHAQSLLGDIVMVEVPAAGTALAQKTAFGTVESVKSVSELFAPASGEVIEVNEALKDAPELVNENANGTWLVRVKLSNPAELETLLDAAAYEQYVAEETDH